MAKGAITKRLADSDDLSKLNAQRDVLSQFDSRNVPILDKASVLFVTAESRNNEPNSCLNCFMLNSKNGTCPLYGPEIKTKKFIWPREPRKGETQIEYWPVCGYHVYGEPNRDEPKYHAPYVDPTDGGLVWVNAPEVGLKYGGSNCGGANHGDNCDFYKLSKDERPEDSKQGFCRVLQTNVHPGDCCAAWADDDIVPWQTAQECLQGPESDREKKRLVSDIMRKES